MTKTTDTADRLLTFRQLADLTGVPSKSWWQIATRGEIPIVRLPGIERRIWVRQADALALIKRSTTQAHP